MELTYVIVLFLVGIVLIVKGGDVFVDAASWFAEVSGIPKVIVGATIVSIATTLPELLVSAMAALDGKVDMSIGNAIGSVTVNIGLIMAISIFCMPGAIKRADYLSKSVLMVAAALLIVISGFMGQMNLWLSLVLLLIFVVFIYENVRSAKASMTVEAQEAREAPDRQEILANGIKFVVGAAAIVVGADLLVDNGSELARFVGVSERIIGVTIIAVGTSLPELVTTITAVLKKQSALSVGNILGANVIDLTLILPLCSLLSGKPLPIAPTSAMIDLPACLLVAAIAVIPAMLASKFQRWQGVLLFVVYGAYLAVTCTLITA